MALRMIAAAATGLLWAAAVGAQPTDLREKYDTEGPAAARQIELAESATDPATALKHLDAALAEEPRCVSAWHRRGNVLFDLGRWEDAVASYRKAWDACGAVADNATVDSGICAGLALARLGRHEEAARWFTKAVEVDPANITRLRAKALEGLAAAHESRGKFLAAGLAALMAPANVGLVGPKQVFNQHRQEAGAQVLLFAGAAPKPAPRKPPESLTEVVVEGDLVAEPVRLLLPDPRGRYVVAIPICSTWYYLIETGAKVTAKKIAVSDRIVSGCLADGRLYLSFANNAAYSCLPIAEMVPDTGRVLRSFPSGRYRVTSIAAFPRRELLFFVGDSNCEGLNTRTGIRFAAGFRADLVAADPRQRRLFSSIDQWRWQGKDMFFDAFGERMFVEAEGLKDPQTTLVESLVVRDGLVVSGLNLTAAASGAPYSREFDPVAVPLPGKALAVSPDGRWVAAMGSKGFDPKDGSRGSGDGAAIFSVEDLESPAAYFTVGPSPAHAAFNPVTSQIAFTRPDGARICDMGAADTAPAFNVKDAFAGPVAWNGRGDLLLLATTGRGVRVLANPLTAAEADLAGRWWKDIEDEERPGVPDFSTPQKALAAASDFMLQNSRDGCALMIQHALDSVGARKPCRWYHFLPYVKDPALREKLFNETVAMEGAADPGEAVGRLRGELQKHPDSPPLAALLARALDRSGQPDEALSMFARAVSLDAGRTDLTPSALASMADVHARRNKDMAAAFCLALAVSVDPSNGETVNHLTRVLGRTRFAGRTRQIAALNEGRVNAPSALLLRNPPAAESVLSAQQLYEKAESVVLVRTPSGAGSGFCIGEHDLIVTNERLVRGRDAADVWPFAVGAGKLVRLNKCAAKVVFRSVESDLALLRLEETPESLVPLALAVGKPGAREKVFVIGDLDPPPGPDPKTGKVPPGRPGLLQGVFASEGRVGLHVYLRHTASVGPGDSGGALLNAKGEVVGIMTMRPGVEGGNAAIPAEDIRKIFSKP